MLPRSRLGAAVSIPAVVVAETVRGAAADAPVNRVLKAVGEVDVVDEAVGRTAGSLLATAVVAGGALVLTGDADDLRALAAGRGEVVVEAL